MPGQWDLAAGAVYMPIELMMGEQLRAILAVQFIWSLVPSIPPMLRLLPSAVHRALNLR